MENLLHWMRRYVSPVFLALLVASFILWYIAKLSYTYTTEQTVRVSVEGQPFEVTCVVEGIGTNLFGYRVYMTKRASDPAVGVEDAPVAGGGSRGETGHRSAVVAGCPGSAFQRHQDRFDQGYTGDRPSGNGFGIGIGIEVMMKVGITGGIGSGKSTVCRLFAQRGIAVYDSDREAKRLMTEDGALRAGITARFGAESYVDGALNRRYLASRVFSDAQALADLNALVHPAVRSDFASWAERQAGPYVILESAILFEAGLEDAVDRTVAVLAPLELRLSRTCRRDGCDEEAVRRRMAAPAGRRYAARPGRLCGGEHLRIGP